MALSAGGGCWLSVRRVAVMAVSGLLVLSAAGCGSTAARSSASHAAVSSSVSAPNSSPVSSGSGSAAGSGSGSSSAAEALCGTVQAPCGASTLGHGASAEPAAATLGEFTEVDLSTFFDSPKGTGVILAGPSSGQPAPSETSLDWGGPGLNTQLFPPQFFPSTGTWSPWIRNMQVPFLVPAWGANVNSGFNLAEQVKIPVPPGKYRGVWLLGGGLGNGALEQLTAQYSDGSSDTEAFHFTGWCQAAKAGGEFLVLQAPYTLTVPLGGGAVTQTSDGCGQLFAVAVPISSAHTLASVLLPATVDSSSSSLWVTAMTLER